MARETDTETIYEKSARLAESMFRDIQESDLPQTLKQDLRETYDFYLDRETRERLASMSPMQRWAASKKAPLAIGIPVPVRRHARMGATLAGSAKGKEAASAAHYLGTACAVGSG